MLKPDVKYTNEEIIDRHCRAIYGDDHDLEWFREHGHMVRKRTAEETYLPWDGLRIPFYYEVIKAAGDELRRQFEDTGYEWDTSDYVPLPSWSDGPIHGDDPDYPLYAITFKSAETNFAENMSIPVIDRLTRGVAALRGALLNPATARALGIEDGDPIEIASRFGRVEGTAAFSEGVHPDTACVANALTRNVPGRRGTVKKTIRASDDVALDLDARGRLVGIDVGNATRVLGRNAFADALTGDYLVGVAEAAKLCGVRKPNFVRDFASREDFPKPVAELASGRIWLRSEIESYLQPRRDVAGKLRHIA